MVNNTTLCSGVKHRNDRRGLSNAQTFLGFLISKEKVLGRNKKVMKIKSICKHRRRKKEGKQSSDMINDHIFSAWKPRLFDMRKLEEPQLGSPHEFEMRRPHILCAAFASVTNNQTKSAAVDMTWTSTETKTL